MNNKLYDKLKFIAQIFLPSLGTLYFALAGIWNFPNAEEVVGTIVAIDTFLGVVLGVSTQQYKNSDARFDGTLTTSETPDKTIVAVEGLHPDELVKKDQVVLKVK